MKQIEKKGKVKKGSVLLTVVVIMMVMVVFLMSTLILTTSANRRSFYTYYQTQAQYAAQAALDAVTNAAYSEQKFYDWVKNGGGAVTLNFDSTDLHLTNGKPLACTVEKVTDPIYVWDNDTGVIRSQAAYKISVTAYVGNGKNETEYTAVNYIYENYKNPVVNPLAENKAEWSHVSSISATTTYGGGSGGGSILQSIFTLAPTSSGNNLLCLGPQTSGLSHIPAGRGNYGTWTVSNIFKNQSVDVGNGLFIGNFSTNDKIYFDYQSKGEGAVFYGNFTMTNEPYFWANFPNGEKSNKYKDLPYLYVDGTLSSTVETRFGYSNTAISNTQVNVYAGAVNLGNGNNVKLYLNGDMYMHDPAMDSYMALDGGSVISAFVDNQVNKSNYGGGYVRGDIISNNHSLNFTKAEVTIGGDLICTNPSGFLLVSGAMNNGLIVQGSVVCAGDLKLSAGNASNMTVYGGIYVKGNVFVTGSDGNWPKINGTEIKSKADLITVNQELASKGANVGKILTVNGYTSTINSDKFAFIESLGITGMSTTPGVTGATDYEKTVNDLMTKCWKYPSTYNASVPAANNYGLYPYCSRPDEIFKTYYRWDLKQSTDAAARALINTDPLILESRYAGHTWDVVAQVSGEGTFYVPCTSSTNLADNAFIDGLTTRTPNNLPFTYINDYSAFPTHTLTTSVTPATLSSSVSNDRLTNVTFSSRNKSGVNSNIAVNNAYVISKSCELDLSAFGKDNAGVSKSTDTGPNSETDTVTIFIDPTQNVGADGTQQQMYVALKGVPQNTYLNIIVNNNMTYADKSSAGVVNYTNGTANSTMATPKVAGRADVAFFFENGFGTNKHFILTTTGAFYQTLARDIDLISNPLYPGQTGWTNNNADSFKYELVPNILVYGQKGVTYTFQNGVFLNAEVLMPDSIYNTPSGDARSKAAISYREVQASVPYVQSASDKNLACMGTLIVQDFLAQNVPECAYIGDTGRGGASTTNYNDVSSNGDKSNNRKTVSDGDFFSNDHQGAN